MRADGRRSGPGEPVRLAVGQPHAAGQHDPRDGLHRRPRLRHRRRRHGPADRRRRRDLDRSGHRHLAGPDPPAGGHAGRRRDPRRRRLRRAPLRRRRRDLPQDVRAGRDQLPGPGRGVATSSRRRSAICCCATATSCARPTAARRSAAAPRSPARRPAPPAARARPADAIFTTTDAGIVFLNGTNTAFQTTDAGASWTPVAGVDPGSVTRMKVISPTAFYAFGPDTLLRSSDGGVDLAEAPGQRRQHDHRHRLRDRRRLPALHRQGRQAAAHRGRRHDVDARHGQHRADLRGRLRQRQPRGRGRLGRRDRRLRRQRQELRAGRRGHRGLVPVRPAARAGARDRARARRQAASSPARPTTALTWKAINVATSADMQDTSFTDANNGYALDQRGGLFRTANGGASWQPIDPGTTSAPQGRDRDRPDACCWPARAASGARRPGGEFSLVSAKAGARRRRRPVRPRRQRDLRLRRDDDRAHDQRRPDVDADQGPVAQAAASKTVALRLRDVDMTSGNGGFALDTSGRVWRTTNGGKQVDRAARRRHRQRPRARVRQRHAAAT